MDYPKDLIINDLRRMIHSMKQESSSETQVGLESPETIVLLILSQMVN